MRATPYFLAVALVAPALTGCLGVGIEAGSSPPPHHRPAPRGEDARATRPGPPPHAPAHGYRHKHERGLELEYDARYGVYVVLDHRDLFFLDDFYFRFENGAWFISARYDGEWRDARDRDIPERLRYERRKDWEKGKRGKGKDKGKGKHRDDDDDDDERRGKGKGRDDDN